MFLTLRHRWDSLAARSLGAAALAALCFLSGAARSQSSPPPPADAPDPPVTLTAAEALVSGAPVPPPDAAPWKKVTLPDNWHESRPGFRGTVWYRIPFQIPAGHVNTHAFYLPRNSAVQLVAWVNGQRVALSIAYGDPRLTELQRPVIFTVPPILLHAGENVVQVRVTGEADYRHGLTRVTIGSGATVRAALYEPRFDAQITVAAVLGGVLFLAGLFSLALWRADRNDRVLLCFAATALAGSVWSWQQLWPPHIEAVWLRNLVLFSLKYLYATPLLVLCLRFGGVTSRRGEAALWGLYLAGCAGAALAGHRYPDFATAALTLYVVLFAACFAWLCTRVWSRAHWQAGLLALAMGTTVGVHACDLARWLGYADFDNLLLTPYGTVFLVLALGATVVGRHVTATRELDRAKRTLEAEVSRQVKEIERSYHAMERMLGEQVLLRERERIMADMHDGLGSSLVSMLALVQSGRVPHGELERRLNGCITDLRAIVDSLEPVEGDLAAVLGNVRYRMRAAFEESGIEVRWDVAELPRVERLTPRVILAIERILLEVLSNALQHAKARTIRFTARVSDDGLAIVIQVVDDGTGFNAAGGSAGRGLKTMAERARGAGLSVDVASRVDGGTTVTLAVPLSTPSVPKVEAGA